MKTHQTLFVFLCAVFFSTMSVTAQNSETRKLDDFDKVALSGSFDIYLEEGDSESVKIEARNTDVENILTDVKDGTLKVKMKKGVRRGSATLYITYTSLDGLNLSGSGNIKSKDKIKADDFSINLAGSGDIDIALECDALKVSIAGSGNVELKGKGDSGKINIAGSGDVDALDFELNTVAISTSGSGNTSIHVTESISASIVGSGDVRYKGEPKTDRIKVMGSGEVRRVND